MRLAMSLPNRLQQVLDEWNVEYRIFTKITLPDHSPVFNMPGITENTAKVCILEDQIGKVQVIFPATRLLDLGKLHVATARTLTPVKPEMLDQIRRGLNLQALPALPHVTGLDTYVDESLLSYESICMELSPDETLEVPQNDFQSLVNNARIGHYTADVPDMRLPGDHWSDTDTVQINRAVRNLTELRIGKRLEETLDMPPMPETAQQIIDLRMDPNAEMEALAKLVGKDPGLAAQVIAWANSPYYGVSGNISNVEEAVIRVLGFDLVINLALGLALGRTLSVPKDGPHGYTPFWNQSVFTAALMSELVKAVPAANRPPVGMAYLCGLLHNFGFMILAHVFPPHALLVNRHIEANPHINRYFIEQHLLGITREQISSNLFMQWGLPEEVFTAIRYQNEPSYLERHSVLSQLLYIASRLLKQQGIGDAPLETVVPESMMTSLHMNKDKAQEGVERVMESSEDLLEMAKLLTG